MGLAFKFEIQNQVQKFPQLILNSKSVLILNSNSNQNKNSGLMLNSKSNMTNTVSNL